MKARRSKSNDQTSIDTSTDTQDSSHKTTVTTKLERRRLIEDLNEERRLKEEMCEF